jgi:hypothetical protein
LKTHSTGRVFVLGTKNFGWNNDFAKTARGNLTDIRVAPIEPVVIFNESARNLIGVDYLDILGLMSDQLGRVPIFTPEGQFITYDNNHLTRAGAMYIGSKLFARYEALVGK